ncbi:hypothetical protein, partial [Archangium sp.]|uniref:hypothetical protein n=1 Tax=Archangium sp. TaxID=1872627 RepID=UPI002ED85716
MSSRRLRPPLTLALLACLVALPVGAATWRELEPGVSRGAEVAESEAPGTNGAGASESSAGAEWPDSETQASASEGAFDTQPED